MLGAHSHIVANFGLLVEQIVLKDAALSSCLTQKTRQHRNGGRFSSSVVSKQSKDLPIVHLHVDSVDGLESVFVLLRQVLDL